MGQRRNVACQAAKPYRAPRLLPPAPSLSAARSMPPGVRTLRRRARLRGPDPAARGCPGRGHPEWTMLPCSETVVTGLPRGACGPARNRDGWDLRAIVSLARPGMRHVLRSAVHRLRASNERRHCLPHERVDVRRGCRSCRPDPRRMLSRMNAAATVAVSPASRTIMNGVLLLGAVSVAPLDRLTIVSSTLCASGIFAASWRARA